MEETVGIILSLIIVFGQSTVKGFDPCTNNVVLGNQESRCPSVSMSGYGLCDRFIPEGWYRVDDGADIPTSCPSPSQCNTQYPVWMHGTVPTVAEGEVQRNACVSSTQECCSLFWTIRVKNCGSYRVYFLRQTDYCPSAYCFEKKTYSTTTLDSSEESSASSSSQDVTSTSTENSESVTQEGMTSNETDTDGILLPLSSISEQPSTTNKQTDVVSTPYDEVNKTSSTSSPDVTHSQVVEKDSPDVLIYVLVAVVGVLCLIIAVIILFLWISRRDGRVIKRKDSKNKQQETTKPSNYYSDLPNSETIYYCIDQAKETENNVENEKRASAQDRNMYLDAIHYPVLTEEFRYDEAKEVEEINVLNMGLENKEMYLKMGSGSTEMYLDMGSERRDVYQEFNRRSLQASSGNDVIERTADTGVNPYECPGKVEENHEYASLPNGNSGCSNAAYEAEQYDKIWDSPVESGSRLSSVSYDDVNFDVTNNVRT